MFAAGISAAFAPPIFTTVRRLTLPPLTSGTAAGRARPWTNRAALVDALTGRFDEHRTEFADTLLSQIRSSLSK